MDIHHIAYFFAVAAGIASSGAVGSLWMVATDEAPHLAMLEEADLLTPLRALVIVFAAPTTLLGNSLWYLIDRPLLGLAMLLAGLGWSFVQGVTIMTQIFGVT